MSKELMIKMGNQVRNQLPKGFGFALIVFPSCGPGTSNYISNAQRTDMIKALRETADRIEKNQDFQTPSIGSN
ncbi:hypothetical protein [Carboxylicivirga linearis]|uniref:Uncharacterized protein n=1 Tax=Carboxylicivirga linearis TaxID=1628157 RepID=A0ABS5JZU6_9BACT|nr:hypothetical protein [Carboxylicivirga linearis]MBS2100413.1 hypothetical protein [Carboxylicivirga linearis]